MDDWTEVARNPNINNTPQSEFTDSAGEQLFLYELGEYALNQIVGSEATISDEDIEEIGRQLDRLVISNEVPSLLKSRTELAEEKGCSVPDVTLQEANKYRKRVMLGTIPQEQLKTIVRSFL